MRGEAALIEDLKNQTGEPVDQIVQVLASLEGLPREEWEERAADILSSHD
jgi:hypothetical protein